MITLDMAHKRTSVSLDIGAFSAEDGILSLSISLGTYDLTGKTVTASFSPRNVETELLSIVNGLIVIPIFSSYIKVGLNHIQLNIRKNDTLEQSPVLTWIISESLPSTVPAQHDVDIITALIAQVTALDSVAEQAATNAATSATASAASATASSTSATSAASSATSAAASADTATAQATGASTSASQAATSASAAAASADEAEQFAQAAQGAIDLVRTNGEYANIPAYFLSIRDGKIYSVKVPKYSFSTSPTCIKADANAGLSVTPSTASVAGSDSYQAIMAFRCPRCNGTVDSSGVPHVTAIEGDGYFAKDGSNGNVWVLTPVIYWRWTEDSNYITISISDTWHTGFSPCPGAYLTDGATLRPFILHAAYAGSKVSNVLASVSGQPLRIRTVSQQSMVSLFSANSQYAGLNTADLWYMQVMFLMKYATKNSQSVFAGCTGYYLQYAPAIAETGVNRVILTNAQAANLLVGSTVSLGTGAVGVDRGVATAFDVFDLRRITSISTYDANNKAINIEGAAFNTTTTGCLSTMPYHSGYCDSVMGVDGSPISATSGKEPFKLQNIECMVGAYEIPANVILNAAKDAATGALSENAYLCYNSGKYATSLTSDYVSTGLSLPIATADGWSYSQDIVNAGGGLLMPKGYGATSSTGLADGVYQNVSTSQGLREWRAFGNLANWSDAGLFAVVGYDVLGGGGWHIASRLSAVGLTHA